MPFNLYVVAARTQLRIARRNIENVFPLLTIPLQALISLAILVHSGRSDLASYALVASLLMTVGQMSFSMAAKFWRRTATNTFWSWPWRLRLPTSNR